MCSRLPHQSPLPTVNTQDLASLSGNALVTKLVTYFPRLARPTQWREDPEGVHLDWQSGLTIAFCRRSCLVCCSGYVNRVLTHGIFDLNTQVAEFAAFLTQFVD